jgi:tRNA wybutosine-synthesizing protein 2
MAVRIRELAKDELNSVADKAWIDTGRKPFVSGETAYVPVREGYTASGTLSPRHCYEGRGYQMIGPVAVVRGEKPTPEEVLRIVEWRHPLGVLWVSSHSGVCRIPTAELLYGTTRDVIHRESGISFCIDPSKVMFSQGNRTEKMRIAALTRQGERVADMYAGIGYFSLPVVRAGGIVHAMEINPVAFDYLQENIRLNKLSGSIVADCGDCRELLSGVYDRVIMGHFDSADAMAHALTHVHPGSVLHVHSSGKQPVDISGQVEAAGFEAGILVRKVKKTGSHYWHYVQDVTLS